MEWLLQYLAPEWQLPMYESTMTISWSIFETEGRSVFRSRGIRGFSTHLRRSATTGRLPVADLEFTGQTSMKIFPSRAFSPVLPPPALMSHRAHNISLERTAARSAASHVIRPAQLTPPRIEIRILTSDLGWHSAESTGLRQSLQIADVEVHSDELTEKQIIVRAVEKPFELNVSVRRV